MPNMRYLFGVLLQQLMLRLALYGVRARRRAIMAAQPQPVAPLAPQGLPRRPRRSATIPRIRLSPLGMTAQQILTTYRFDFRTIQDILADIEDDISPGINTPSAIPPLLKLLCVLHFCATGTFQHTIALLHGLGQPTMSKILVQVMAAFIKRVDHHIFMPVTTAQINMAKAEFYAIAQFPGVLGCADCTHIPVVPPSAHEAAFRNRKMTHSMNVQMVCAANLCIIQLCARFPGSAHDARILRESRLFDHMEQLRLPRTWILGEYSKLK